MPPSVTLSEAKGLAPGLGVRATLGYEILRLVAQNDIMVHREERS